MQKIEKVELREFVLLNKYIVLFKSYLKIYDMMADG